MRYLLIVAMLFCAASAYAGDAYDQRNGRPGDDRGGPPRVYDAQGKYVGQFATNSGMDGVFLKVGDAVTFVGIERVPVGTQLSATQFQWTVETYVNFPSADCSGPPVLQYINAQGLLYVVGPRPSLAVRQGTDVVLYVAGQAGSTNVSVRSYYPGPYACMTAGYPLERNQVFLPDTSVPLTQMFPEPLSIRY